METVLDVGCGTGNITEYFFERFKPCRLVGFDLSTDMVNFARAHHMVKEPEKTVESMEIDETKMDGKQNASDLKKNSKLPGSSSKGNISKAKDGKVIHSLLKINTEITNNSFRWLWVKGDGLSTSNTKTLRGVD